MTSLADVGYQCASVTAGEGPVSSIGMMGSAGEGMVSTIEVFSSLMDGEGPVAFIVFAESSRGGVVSTFEVLGLTDKSLGVGRVSGSGVDSQRRLVNAWVALTLFRILSVRIQLPRSCKQPWFQPGSARSTCALLQAGFAHPFG